jgi:hypothetical protein
VPHISQPYVIPLPGIQARLSGNNDTAVYSMWEHFLDFCKSDSLSIINLPRHVQPLNPYQTTNSYTGSKRLPVFLSLSQMKKVSSK